MNIDQDSELTGSVIGAAIAVHRELGPGLDEMIYEQALSSKLNGLGVPHVCQQPLPLIYKEAVLDCGFRLDLFLDDRLPIELKAVETLLPIHDAQLLTYMRLGRYPLGLMVNFEVAVLKDGVRRRVLTAIQSPIATRAPQPEPRFDSLSAELIDAALDVYRILGPGLMRSAYEECLCHELRLRQIGFVRKRRFPLRFEGFKISDGVEIPLLVADRIPVVCLSVPALTKLHEAHLLARVRQTGASFGFLLNFNAPIFRDGVRRMSLEHA